MELSKTNLDHIFEELHKLIICQVWILIALADYFLFPYDFQSAKSFDNINWVIQRSNLSSW